MSVNSKMVSGSRGQSMMETSIGTAYRKVYNHVLNPFGYRKAEHQKNLSNIVIDLLQMKQESVYALAHVDEAYQISIDGDFHEIKKLYTSEMWDEVKGIVSQDRRLMRLIAEAYSLILSSFDSVRSVGIEVRHDFDYPYSDYLVFLIYTVGDLRPALSKLNTFNKSFTVPKRHILKDRVLFDIQVE